MIKKIEKKQLGTAYHTWIQSLFHFSHTNYHQPSNTFGVLRVINDDILHAGSGHDLHKHKDVEILTYILGGLPPLHSIHPRTNAFHINLRTTLRCLIFQLLCISILITKLSYQLTFYGVNPK